MLDDGGSTTEIASTETGEFAAFGDGSVNDNGDVAFWALKDDGISGFYVVSGGTLAKLAEGADLRPFELSIGAPRINNKGSVVFTDSWGGAVYLSNGGTLSNITNQPDIPSPAFGHPMLNGDDVVVFTGSTNPALYLWGGIFRSTRGGPPERVLAASDVGLSATLFNASINDAGTIAYYAQSVNPNLNAVLTQPLTLGLYVLKTPSPVKVIAAGDPLFGAKVTLLSGTLALGRTSRFINSSGQIVFGYTLDNGARGIAVATPNP
jgi:hypothetical protein